MRATWPQIRTLTHGHWAAHISLQVAPRSHWKYPPQAEDASAAQPLCARPCASIAPCSCGTKRAAHLGFKQFTVPTGHKIDSPTCVVLMRWIDPQSKESHTLLSTEKPRNHSSREIRCLRTPESFLRFISRHPKYLY
jgi:hypothetical protein